MCPEVGNPPDEYCKIVKHNSSLFFPQRTYCVDTENRVTKEVRCSNDREPSPISCRCAYPATGLLTFRSPSFSGYTDRNNFDALWRNLTDFFENDKLVWPVGFRNIREDETDHYLLMDLVFFPYDKERYTETEMGTIISKFSTNTYKPPEVFGPYVFQANNYKWFPGMITIKLNLNLVI